MNLMRNRESYESSSERFEKLYLMLLDAIPSSVLMIDRDMRIVSANRNFLDKSRRSMADTIGRRLEDIFPAIILEQMNIVRQIQQAFNNNRPTLGQRMSYRSPGVPMRIYYYRILPFSMVWEGTVENVMLLMDDVTEQIRLGEEVRRVERHMASVSESASDIILSTDINGNILSWNPAAEKISGYTFHEVKHKSFFKYIADDWKHEVKKVFSSMKSINKTQMNEWDLIPKTGISIPVSWVCSRMKDEQSRAIGIVAVGRDQTERRKLEAQLLQSQKFTALGVMAGGIAHEIRNPLAICSSGAQFLLDENIAVEFRRECAEKINAGIQRASIIIENLLRFARPAVTSKLEQLKLPALIQEAWTLIDNQAKIQKIESMLQFEKNHIVINGNASLLQQVFINLFLNGIQAMPDGGTLTISIETTGKEVLVRITDTGQGISGNDIDKIFDPFYTTSPVGQGTGLGLSICYSIVELHNGSIEVESREGKGSTFTVKLPVQ
ncbi:MAG: PAS domain S-box protein [Proteobacteria bacterium]|nr:PAS domain S-box protein [Pseudomonadota bacterium]